MASFVSPDLERIWNLTALREVESSGTSKVVEKRASSISSSQHLRTWKAGGSESPASWRSRKGENSIAAQASALHPQYCQNQQLIPPASWAYSSQPWPPRRSPYCIPPNPPDLMRIISPKQNFTQVANLLEKLAAPSWAASADDTTTSNQSHRTIPPAQCSQIHAMSFPIAYSKFEFKSISQIESTTSCHYRMI